MFVGVSKIKMHSIGRKTQSISILEMIQFVFSQSSILIKLVLWASELLKVFEDKKKKKRIHVQRLNAVAWRELTR